MSTSSLSSEKIYQALAALPAQNRVPPPAPLQIVVLTQTTSTNADLLAQADTLSGPQALFAERQSAGRGRAGRAWHSEPENSLTFSLAWKFSAPLQALLGLPLAVGVALAEALAQLGVQVQLKWPNDLLKDGKKLAGILIETITCQSEHWAVIGIGMNLQVSADLEEKIGKQVADAPWLAQLDRNILAAHLLDSLTRSLEQFAEAGLAPFTERWQQLHAFAGEEVLILDQGQIVQQGRASGVDHQGRLLLDTPNGQLAIVAGDVSLRSQAQFANGERG